MRRAKEEGRRQAKLTAKANVKLLEDQLEAQAKLAEAHALTESELSGLEAKAKMTQAEAIAKATKRAKANETRPENKAESEVKKYVVELAKAQEKQRGYSQPSKSVSFHQVVIPGKLQISEYAPATKHLDEPVSMTEGNNV